MTTPIGAFGAPPDGVAWAAFGAGLALLAWNLRERERDATVSDRVLVAALAAAAALLSGGYVLHYLRGGPRIIDATSYFLEARAFSEGHVAFSIPAPSGSFRGRFLLASYDARSVSVIFPPGYPALLALGFLARAPMLVGPVLAAALVLATYAVTNRLFGDRRAGRLAAALSAVCAVLRYHTADTMSHGFAALLFAVALWASLDNRRSMTVLAGAAAGSLIATRPVSGMLCLSLVLAASLPRARWPFALLGATLPVATFVLEQHAATGAWLVSSQGAYYAVADGPPGCFRYGFGPGIGCRFEHGDFVAAHLEHGYGFVAASGTTLRRLKMHLADAGNAELFFPFLIYALVRSCKERRGRLAAVAVAGIVAAYAPFYFDGNYPGGGARFFADTLPLEHALLAWVLVELRLRPFAAPAALLGFACHTSYDHRQLAERDGGRPMFERSIVERAGVRRGLVLVSTDHGFNLGFDPRAAHEGGLVVARRRGDAHDALLWQTLGRPDVYEYSFDPSRRGAVPTLSPLTLGTTGVRRFEAESEWPPLAVIGGSVEPVFPPCASRGRALWVLPRTPGEPARVRVELPEGAGVRERVRLGWVVGTAATGAAHLAVGGASWDVVPPPSPGCVVTEGPVVRPGDPAFLDVSVDAPLGIDFVEVRPALEG